MKLDMQCRDTRMVGDTSMGCHVGGLSGVARSAEELASRYRQRLMGVIISSVQLPRDFGGDSS